MAGPNPAGPTGGFTGITVSTGPSASAFNSIMESIASAISEGQTPTYPVPTPTTEAATEPATTQPAATPPTPTSNTAKTSATVVATSAATHSADTTSRIPTTLSTSTIISSAGTMEGLSTSASSSQSSTTAANAASTTPAGVLSESATCNSVSCDSGLQAAIAVPVVFAVLGLIGLYFCLARRSRRRRAAASGTTGAPMMSEKGTPKNKKWSRHLRVFSFGDEMLMGGRFSSTNSIRSRETGSTRSNRRESGNQSDNPSINSLEEVAPPYRDAVSTAHGPAHPSGTAGHTHTERPSTATSAPPPYVMLGGSKGSRNSKRPQTPTSQRSLRDPFRDSNPVSPIEGEGSPFNDPPDDDPSSPSRPMMSRQSSMMRSLNGINEDARSAISDSDVGSVREAQLGRNASVMSGGRVIDNVRVNSTSSRPRQ